MPSAQSVHPRHSLDRVPVEEHPSPSLPTASSQRPPGSPLAHRIESEPLLAGSSTGSSLDFTRHSSALSSSSSRHTPRYSYLLAVMEKLSDSKIGRFAKKLEVDNEDGLTNAQLMLTNNDLKPGTIRISVMDKQAHNLPSRTRTSPMGSVELCGLLDCRLVQYRMWDCSRVDGRC